jgi:hypothetical protein
MSYEEEEDTRECGGCRATAPAGPSTFTLISKSWRVLRDRSKDGELKLVWMCPECWSRLRKTAR